MATGQITIQESSVAAGDTVHVHLQSPPDKPFMQQIRLYKDPNPSDVAANKWSSAMTGLTADPR